MVENIYNKRHIWQKIYIVQYINNRRYIYNGGYIYIYNRRYSQILKITDQKWISISIYKTIKYLNSIFYITQISKLIIFLKLKGSKYKYSSKTILIICKLKKLG